MSSAYARTPPGREGTTTKGSESLTLSESINFRYYQKQLQRVAVFRLWCTSLRM